MTCRLMLGCDFDGCDATAEVVGANDGGGGVADPIVSDDTRGCWEATWVDLPAGWVFVTGGERCSNHAGR